MTGRTVRTMLRLVLVTSVVAGVLVQPGAAHAAATITVNTFIDEYGEGDDCSLREALANAGSDGTFGGGCVGAGAFGDDTILLPPGVYTLTRDGAETQGEKDLDVVGSGDLTIQSMGGTAQDTIVQAGTIGFGGIQNGIDRVFEVTSSDDVTFRDMTIRNGQTAGDGGGILFSGTSLTLERVAVRASSSADDGGGIAVSANQAGTLRLNQVEVSGNATLDEDGGGIWTQSGVFANGLTVSGNSAYGHGGGIAFSDGFHGLAATTITGNVANSDDIGTETGGGIFADAANTPDTNFTGTIVAGNTLGQGGTSPDCAGDFNVTDDFAWNIVQNATGCTGFNGEDLGIDPQLQPLALNAPGATRTHALPATSPAVDRWPTDGGGGATPSDGCLTNVGKFGVQSNDQRGVSRPQGSACDSGAYELEVTSQAPPGVCKGKTATLTGTQGNDVLVGTKGNDVIAALSGNDTVKAGKGKDLVCGGDGNDKLSGQGGNDKLLGENGNDKLKGGGGNDKMVGGKGKDRCGGGGGDKDKAKKCEKVSGVP